MDSSQDRNLPATPQRLRKAREDGQVPRSRDLIHLVVLAGGLIVLALLVPWVYERMRLGMRASFTFDHAILLQSERLLLAAADVLAQGLLAYLPLGLVLVVAIVAVSVASGGYAFSTKPLMPDFSKLGLISGFKRLFSKQQLFEIIKIVAVTLLLSLLTWLFVRNHLAEFSTLLSRPLLSSMQQLADWFKGGVVSLLAVVFVLALIDVPLQQFLFRQRLKMSLQEVKDEHKESDGNPQLKSRMRQRQRELAQSSSVSKVPQADLVVMNPTHYAVALRYDDATMNAPHVIAKGADLVALRIRDMAKDHKVPVLTSPRLARALYAHTELDQQIPSALFTAVAQVLAYVFQLKAAMRGEGPMPGQQPEPDVPDELDPHHGRPTAAPPRGV